MVPSAIINISVSPHGDRIQALSLEVDKGLSACKTTLVSASS